MLALILYFSLSTYVCWAPCEIRATLVVSEHAKSATEVCLTVEGEWETTSCWPHRGGRQQYTPRIRQVPAGTYRVIARVQTTTRRVSLLVIQP